LNGWWWYWKSLSGQFGYVAPTTVLGSEHPGPLPFVQPGAPTSPSALDQPPEYHAQSMPLADRRSPIVGLVCAASCASVPCGRYGGWIVLTA
jgi:hypothetical protein